MTGALLGDCIGGEFEGKELVRMQDVIEAVRALEEHRQEEGSLAYSDDTAMTRCVAQSLITKQDFDEVDMAKRFAEEYKEHPNRGYGSGVIRVFKKLLSPNCNDVFKPAREQFKGKGSYGNGGAMRIAPIALAYPDVQDVKKSLSILVDLLGHCLCFHEFPYCNRLKKMKTFLSRTDVSKEEVVNELGNGIAAFESVPTAIYSFLRCMDPDPEIPEKYNGLERTIIYSISLGGDTDTIATMAGAIAGAYYGKDLIPESWQKSCEAYKDADYFGSKLCDLYYHHLASLKTG
ncbi:ADP-ribosylhydrolase ARH3 isoform X2 [Heterodontus francisci]|uniref:ADP-ribosylhydrolase ARH3 isoform X2 n=1 Tax=Heterodontus francisci TaxID=7792 RepID=UPI00355B3A0B